MTFDLSAEDIKNREISRFSVDDISHDWSLVQKVAITCRVLFEAGHDSGLSGQITARTGCGEFITQRLGIGFDETSVSNLLIVNQHLDVISGNGTPNPANRFHSWIYAERPDVNCIIHTHSIYSASLSMLGVPLAIGHTDSCILFDQTNFLPKWDGIPIGNFEGETISKALGEKKALLLAHHGLVVAGSSVEESCAMALQFERAAKMQLLAMSAGNIAEIDPKHALEARDWLLQEKRIVATFNHYARRALRFDNSCLV